MSRSVSGLGLPVLCANGSIHTLTHTTRYNTPLHSDGAASLCAWVRQRFVRKPRCGSEPTPFSFHRRVMANHTAAWRSRAVSSTGGRFDCGARRNAPAAALTRSAQVNGGQFRCWCLKFTRYIPNELLGAHCEWMTPPLNRSFQQRGYPALKGPGLLTLSFP